MNVQQLIAELSKMPPRAPVKVLLSSIWLDEEEAGIELFESDATELDLVSWQGNHVLLKSA